MKSLPGLSKVLKHRSETLHDTTWVIFSCCYEKLQLHFFPSCQLPKDGPFKHRALARRVSAAEQFFGLLYPKELKGSSDFEAQTAERDFSSPHPGFFKGMMGRLSDFLDKFIYRVYVFVLCFASLSEFWPYLWP